MLTGEKLGKAIKTAITRKGITQADLARAFGVRPASVSGWIKYGRINKPHLVALIEYFSDVVGPDHWGLKDSTLAVAERRGTYAPINTSPGPSITGRVPLISWTSAGHWCELVDHLPPGDAEDWIATTAKVGPHAFALRIRGDSMEPTIPDGALVIVDPDTPAEHNRIVIVRQNGNTECTCKRLVTDGGRAYLRPDNPRYPIINMATDAVVCGVVRQVVINMD